MTNPSDEGRIIISREHEKMFRDLAPRALAHRSPEWMLAQFLQMAQWILIGGIGLIGMYWWQWSPLVLLLVFLAGNYVGMLFDFLRIVFNGRRVKAELDRFFVDQMVWNIVMAKMMGKDSIAPTGGSASVKLLVIVDVVGGVLAAFFFLVSAKNQGVDWIGEIARNRGLQIALSGLVVLPLLSALLRWHGAKKEKDPVPDLVKSGGRGLGMFIFAFVLGAFGESKDMVRNAVVFINIATIVLGLIALFGCIIMYKETEWLKAHLREQGKPQAANQGKPRTKQ